MVPLFLNGQKNLIGPEEVNKLMGSNMSIMSGIKEAMSGHKPNDSELPQFNNNLLQPYKSISKGVAKSLRTGFVNKAFENEDHPKVRQDNTFCSDQILSLFYLGAKKDSSKPLQDFLKC